MQLYTSSTDWYTVGVKLFLSSNSIKINPYKPHHQVRIFVVNILAVEWQGLMFIAVWRSPDLRQRGSGAPPSSEPVEWVGTMKVSYRQGRARVSLLLSWETSTSGCHNWAFNWISFPTYHLRMEIYRLISCVYCTAVNNRMGAHTEVVEKLQAQCNTQNSRKTPSRV